MGRGGGRVRRRGGRLHERRRRFERDRRGHERRAGHLHLLGELRGHDRVGPGDRLLERGHRPPQHLRDAHALQRRDPGGRTAPGRLVGVVEGRPDVDVHAPPGRDVPHGQPAHGGRREGLDRAHDGDRRGRGLHLGRGEEDRRARRHDPRVPPVVPLAARPRVVRHVLGLHLRHDGQRRAGPRRLVRRRQRRRHRPVHGHRVQPRRRDRAPPRGLPRLLGRVGRRRSLRALRLPRHARGEHRGPAAARGRGLDGPADEPAAVGLVRGAGRLQDRERAVVADAARHAEHRRRPARRPAGPRRDHEGGRLQRDDRRPRGRGATRSRAWCRRACGATPTGSSTSRTSTRRRRRSSRPGSARAATPSTSRSPT